MTEDTDGNDGRKGTLAKLLDLLTEMDTDARGEGTRRGRWSRERSGVDYTLSTGGAGIRGGVDDSGEFGFGPPASGERPEPNVTTRETDGGVLVVADLPGVDASDVSLGIDQTANAFTLGVGGEVVGRIPVDDGDWVVTDASFANGILEVRLRAD
jgi:HSP20 family molecular chaperone IbpA